MAFVDAGTSRKILEGMLPMKITLAGAVVTLADEAGVVAHGGLKIYDFPVGNLAIIGAVADCDVVAAGGIDVASIGPMDGLNTAAAFLDGTGTAKDAFLNILIDDADQDGGGTVTVTGTITITWMQLGDK